MTKAKYNFFEQITMAITKPMQFFRLTKISVGRMIGFVFLFVLLTSLIFMLPISFIMAGPKGITSYLDDNVPAFQFSNGEFHMESRFEEKDSMNYFLIDTSVERFNKDDIDDLYDQVILISKTNMITYQYGNLQEFDFNNLGNLKFDNRILSLLKPLIYLCLFFVMAFYYFFLIAAYFLTALLYSLVGLIVSYAANINIKFSTLYRTAIYAKVTSSILFAIYFVLMLLTPLTILWAIVFGVIILIDCAYMVYGTISHSSDAAQDSSDHSLPPQNPYSGPSF